MAKLELQTRNFRQFDNVEDSVRGVIKGFFSIQTRFGSQECIAMISPEGEDFCVGCTSNLALYLPQLAEGMDITITRMEDAKNVKTKNVYRVFEIDLN